jgi:glycosyltransferase involved in cell wall biosynthesis
MTRRLRHLLAFDASLAGDPYLCWLYAAQFAATTGAATGRAGFLPLFPYRGPQPARLGMEMLRGGGGQATRRHKTLWQRLHLAEDPAVTVSSLDAGRRRLLEAVGALHRDLESIVLFGTAPVDVAELAKLVHVGCDTRVPAIVCVVRRTRAPDIVTAGLGALAIPVYLDIGFDLSQEATPQPRDGASARRAAGSAEVHGAFSFWSEPEYPFAARRGAPADWSSILAATTGRPRAPVVLFLRPDWPNCGSFTTFKSIALRYAERGTVILDVAIDENRRKYSEADASDRLWDARHDLSPALAFAGARSRTLSSRWGAMAGRRGGLVAEHVRRYTGAAAPQWLRRLLRTCRPDYAYVNHYFTMDYLRKLRLDIPVILDTHDIQSVNYLHHRYASKGKGRSETFSDLIAQETSYFRRARAIAFVSADELELAAARLPDIDMFHFIAVPEVERAPAIAPATGDARCRILIVASRNPGNEANVAWFLERVWPRLRDAGVQLDIVGTIASFLEGREVPEGCTLHGAVPSLADFYARSDVVALPIVTGAGVAIKTIEALLHDRPISATPHAFRGLGRSLRSRFPLCDDAETFAADLRSLIEDPAAARARLELCREAAAALAPERFDAAFDRRHRAMLAAQGKAASLPTTASRAAKYRALENKRS